MIAVSLAVELLIMTGIGFAARKLNIIQDQFSSQVSAFLMNLALPCLVFNSMTQIAFSAEILRSCIIVFVLSVAVNAVQLLLGQAVYIISGKSDSGRLARYGMITSHSTFMGVPVVNALFGDLGNMYYAIFLAPVRLVYYGLSKVMLMPPRCEQSKSEIKKDVLKAFVCPSVLAIPVAVIFAASGLTLPVPVANCVASMAKLCSPLGLILCGTVLGRYSFKKLFCRRYFYLPIIRTILMPIVFLIITRPLIWLGVELMIVDMIVIYTAMPIASLMPTFVMQYDPDLENQFEAAGATIIATLMSMVTIPTWYFILQTLA